MARWKIISIEFWNRCWVFYTTLILLNISQNWKLFISLNWTGPGGGGGGDDDGILQHFDRNLIFPKNLIEIHSRILFGKL